MDHSCPSCSRPIRSRELAGQSRRHRYRTCPSCRARIVVDPLTRRRHVVALVLGLVVLGLAITAAVRGAIWSVGAVVGSVALVAWIAYSERRLRFVPYNG